MGLFFQFCNFLGKAIPSVAICSGFTWLVIDCSSSKPSSTQPPQIQLVSSSNRAIPYSQREDKVLPYPSGWADEHNFLVHTVGFPPEDKKSESLKSLLACENARNRALRIFQDMAAGLKAKYTQTEVDESFVLITTVHKENNSAFVCRIVVQFFSPQLKKRIDELPKIP